MSTSTGGYLDSPTHHGVFWLYSSAATAVVLIITFTYIFISHENAKDAELVLKAKQAEIERKKNAATSPLSVHPSPLDLTRALGSSTELQDFAQSQVRTLSTSSTSYSPLPRPRPYQFPTPKNTYQFQTPGGIGGNQGSTPSDS